MACAAPMAVHQIKLTLHDNMQMPAVIVFNKRVLATQATTVKHAGFQADLLDQVMQGGRCHIVGKMV